MKPITEDLTQWNEFAWFIGLYEGEGNICRINDKRFMIQIQMTDEDVIQRCANFLGGVKYITLPGYYEGNKERYKVQCAGNPFGGKLYDLFMAMLPHLSQRRQEQVHWHLRERYLSGPQR
tara:strand:+ start:327 stop:686 length:360 start_codon:yes stop_codon:yes gene_type:complete